METDATDLVTVGLKLASSDPGDDLVLRLHFQGFAKLLTTWSRLKPFY